ncbi:MAG: hypothetical protein H0U95_16655 [Bacteroidetes bacterium]|nr:hypothetical protein [Bacteroidota bacterium]
MKQSTNYNEQATFHEANSEREGNNEQILLEHTDNHITNSDLKPVKKRRKRIVVFTKKTAFKSFF